MSNIIETLNELRKQVFLLKKGSVVTNDFSGSANFRDMEKQILAIIETLQAQNQEMLKKIVADYKVAKSKRKEFELGFNIFSLVSDTYYKENFHSQIIQKLLDPNGGHNEGRIFLDCFLETFGIDKTNFQNGVVVSDELPIEGSRRIDILVSSTKHAIIIENKINDAIDMNNQLVDYYRYCIGKGLTVDKIFYLSKEGCKQPDKNKWKTKDDEGKKIENLITTMAAFDLHNVSLNHWLEKCISVSTNPDVSFMIKQYLGLLKSLRGYLMETDSIKKYYELIQVARLSEKEKAGEEVKELHQNLALYFPYKLMESLPNISSNVWDSTGLLIPIGNDPNYYLKVTFKGDSLESIYLMDNSKKWEHDAKLKMNPEFMNLFANGNVYWNYKIVEDFDLINDFTKLRNEVKIIIQLLEEIFTSSSASVLS